VVDCFGDVGVDQSLRMQCVPIVGLCRTSLCVASLVAHRVAIICPVQELYDPIVRMVRAYGFQDLVVSVRWIGVDPGKLHVRKRASVVKALSKAAATAVLDDRAEAVILGCSGFLGMVDAMHDSLSSTLPPDTPAPVVIDPLPLAFEMAAVLVKLCRARKP
jgi:allantoin racemase